MPFDRFVRRVAGGLFRRVPGDGFPAGLTVPVACAITVASASLAIPATGTLREAEQAVARFDSLVTVASGRAPEDPVGLAAAASARAMTAGTARRLFPLLLEAQRRVAPALDTARSFDTVLHAAAAGPWAALTVRSVAVFTRPVLGLTGLDALQGVHLHDASGAGGWRIVDFEELADGARAVPRTGAPPPGEPASSGTSLLPVSPRTPSRGDFAKATRLRLRVAFRDGDTLLPPSTPSQRRVSPPGAAAAAIEVAVPPLPRPARALTQRNDRALAPYLASTSWIDLSDSLLRAQAETLARGSSGDVETARRIWNFVASEFDYRLGATLFATSREALRDRSGDCSEAAVLVAALLRAAGIPSRVVLGYATLGDGVWIGHAWAEAHLGGADGAWIGVDAALREFPAGPRRVALATSAGDGDLRAAATNLMLRTLGNLDIHVEAAWAGDRALPLASKPDAGAADRFLQHLLEGIGKSP